MTVKFAPPKGAFERLGFDREAVATGALSRHGEGRQSAPAPARMRRAAPSLASGTVGVDACAPSGPALAVERAAEPSAGHLGRAAH